MRLAGLCLQSPAGVRKEGSERNEAHRRPYCRKRGRSGVIVLLLVLLALAVTAAEGSYIVYRKKCIWVWPCGSESLISDRPERSGGTKAAVQGLRTTMSRCLHPRGVQCSNRDNNCRNRIFVAFIAKRRREEAKEMDEEADELQERVKVLRQTLQGCAKQDQDNNCRNRIFVAFIDTERMCQAGSDRSVIDDRPPKWRCSVGSTLGMRRTLCSLLGGAVQVVGCLINVSDNFLQLSQTKKEYRELELRVEKLKALVVWQTPCWSTVQQKQPWLEAEVSSALREADGLANSYRNGTVWFVVQTGSSMTQQFRDLCNRIDSCYDVLTSLNAQLIAQAGPLTAPLLVRVERNEGGAVPTAAVPSRDAEAPMGVAADGVPAHNAAADDGQEAGEDRDQRIN
ncbi:uncharacterized protein [Miscanthus floridulus]|uniref:uncharacterized protein isoform X2 n=1 Tax=Miscanthus floridulus TaxID=154761 RepID=UPI003459510A